MKKINQNKYKGNPNKSNVEGSHPFNFNSHWIYEGNPNKSNVEGSHPFNFYSHWIFDKQIQRQPKQK